MNGNTDVTIKELWFRNGKILLAEFVLLAISIVAAFVPMAGYNTAVNLTIAFIMAIIGLLFFMGLVHEGVLMRLAGGAGVFWIAIMFLLTFADYFTRPN